jgi:hypothetical protein
VVFPDPGIVDAGGWLADIAAHFVDHGSGMVIVDQSDQQPLDQDRSCDAFEAGQDVGFEQQVAVNAGRDPFRPEVIWIALRTPTLLLFGFLNHHSTNPLELTVW